MKAPVKILVAGVGNELRQDDAFGIELVRYLSSEMRPAGVTVLEVGIGGIHLVQELHEGYDILILADAVAWGQPPGHIYFRAVEGVKDITQLPVHDKRAFLADMHYTNPSRALMLAKALDVLPEKVYILGCESERHDDFAIGMSPVVQAAIPRAAEKLQQWLAEQTAPK